MILLAPTIRKKKRGIALVSALLVLVILATICGGFVSIMAQNTNAARKSADDTILLYTAEAGLEYAKWCVKHNLTYYPVRDLYTAQYTTVPKIKAGGLYNFWGSAAYFMFPGFELNTAIKDTASISRRYEYVYWSSLSYSSSTASGSKNVFLQNGETRYLATFQIATGLKWDNAGVNSTYNNVSDANYVRAVASSGQQGFPVELSSTARLWRLNDGGRLYNAFNGNSQSGQNQLQLIETATLLDKLGATLEATRTLSCTFQHAINADQYKNSYPQKDYYDVNTFKNYRDWAR